MSFINYAHRGASEYAPENTLFAFNLGVYMGANGIETDVQFTKDGVAVLFHDDTIERMTGQPGAVSDYTYAELQAFRVTKDGYSEIIPTLEDFLKYFHFRPLTFAIELKQRGTARRVADILRQYHITEKIVVTSFIFEEIADFCACAPEFKTGFLTSNITDELLARMKELGIGEICPKAVLATPENVAEWHALGFNVRAWGVSDTTLMQQAFDAGCDGMTVNFPDKLTLLLQSK